MLFLNSDLGESYGIWSLGNDRDIMPLIDQANIACGGHASDPQVMTRAVALAKQHNVSIVAHPGYADKQGFGRRSIPMSHDDIVAMLHYQVGALYGIATVQGKTIDAIKPHGALYNDMMAKTDVLHAVLTAVSSLSPLLKTPTLVMLASEANQKYQKLAETYEVTLSFEAFADRNYTDEGSLVSRQHNNAVIHDKQHVLARIDTLLDTGTILSEHGKPLKLAPDTLCVHSDTPDSLALAQALRQQLNAKRDNTP